MIASYERLLQKSNNSEQVNVKSYRLVFFHLLSILASKFSHRCG